jgi:rod shape-determining protein MreC
MVVSYNNFQQAKFLTSSNGLSGYFYENFAGVFQVFDLKKANTELAEENAQLRTALQHYQLRTTNNSRQSYLSERNPLITMTRDSLNKIVYLFTTARVINNSINQRHNFLTINKGRYQGVKENMGVMEAERQDQTQRLLWISFLEWSRLSQSTTERNTLSCTGHERRYGGNHRIYP